MKNNNFEEKIAFVTGVSNCIDKYAGLAFAHEDDHMAIPDISKDHIIMNGYLTLWLISITLEILCYHGWTSLLIKITSNCSR